jgi:hypothetical protein
MPRPRFTPGERTPGTHRTGGWVGPRAGLAKEARRKILLPLLGIEPRPPGRPVLSQTLYWLSYQGSDNNIQYIKPKYITCTTISCFTVTTLRRKSYFPYRYAADHWIHNATDATIVTIVPQYYHSFIHVHHTLRHVYTTTRNIPIQKIGKVSKENK